MMNTETNSALSRPSLAGKVALITGGTTGIGRACVERFHAAGAQLIVTGENRDRLEQARRELPDDVLLLRADARSLGDAEELAREVRTRFGRLDVLFLNAGIAKLCPFDAVDEAFYDEHLAVNVKGLVFTLQKLLPLIGRGGSVLLNTSLAAHRGAANLSIYSLSKGAVSALGRSLAVELAPRGIRVNAISPATILTPIQGKFGLPPSVAEQVARDYCARIPLGRFGEAHEVADLALLLASDSASYLTGAEIPVDGGLAIA
jgi:NAD(P)-dependent dehydrogenase (short-subunit alcohol dehydrogenase family)